MRARAEELLITLGRDNPALGSEKVGINGADELFERYGLCILVLLGAASRELDWPFAAGQLREFTGL